LIELHPWQETYLLEDDAEVLCLEPELDCLGPLIEYFGTLENRYLIIHAKSANVEWMTELKHNGNTIVVWSVCGPSQAEQFEPVAASTDERIAAARALQDAGYVVRYKLKPIIPMRNWREEAADTVAMMFAQTNPDVVSLCMFMWTSYTEMTERLDLSLLDPEFVGAAEAAQEELRDKPTRPFPPRLRTDVYMHYLREIRRHDLGVPVSLSTESPGVWRRMEHILGTTPATYVCGCGPNSTPWRTTLPCNPFTVTADGPQGGMNAL
jgi:spore photoproduct lyase